jgi:secretion/DNA translocation related CpaE-like protein
MATSPVRPLVVTADAQLLDDVLRLAAAAATDVDVAPDPAVARRLWPAASLVLVGDDLSRPLAHARLRRRPGVVLVGREASDAGIWQRAVAIGAEHVALLPDAEPWLVTRLGEAGEGVDRLGRIVCVVGGRGGAGASTLAAGLAVTGMRQQRRTMLVDADPLGGGADLLFGGEEAVGVRWPELASAGGRIAGSALQAGLPAIGALAVLSWDRGELIELAPDAMASVLDAAARSCELVVVDVARHFDEVGRVALAASDLTLLVVPAEVRATAAAARVAGGIRGMAVDLRLVVRGPAPGGLEASDVAAWLDLPLAGRLKPEPDLEAALERGEAPAGRGVGPLARLCRQLIAELTVPSAASMVNTHG